MSKGKWQYNRDVCRLSFFTAALSNSSAKGSETVRCLQASEGSERALICPMVIDLNHNLFETNEGSTTITQ